MENFNVSRRDLLMFASLSLASIGCIASSIIVPPFTGPTYIGPVASRASTVPTSLVSGTTTYMSRKFFDATENIRDIQLKIPNFAVTGNGVAETNSGGILTCLEAWLEYPIGQFQRITFGGSNSGSTAGDWLTSDLTPLFRYVPRFARAFIVYAISNTVAMPVSTVTAPTFGSPQYVPSGDATQAGGTDHTNVVNDGTGTSVWPLAILGTTQYASFANIGDSRGVLESAFGGTDFSISDSTGLVGEAMRALGGQYGFINLGVPGDQEQRFISAYKKRALLAQNATHIFCGYGINNTTGGVATFLNDYDIIREAVATKPFYGPTLAPHPSSSSDGWTTLGNQTVSGGQVTINAINVSVRGTLPASWTGVQDIANHVEFGGSGSPSGKWNVPNYTFDGLHASAFGNKQIVFSFATSPVYTPPVALTAANSNPSLWLEGDVNVTTVAGPLVTTWLDQSTNAISCTASGALRPTTSASINGKQCISFNGSTALTMPAAAFIGVKTIVLVGKLGNTSTAEQVAVCLKDVGGTTGSEFIFLNFVNFRQVTFAPDQTASNQNTVGYDPTNDLNAHSWIATYLAGGTGITDVTQFFFTQDGVMQPALSDSVLNRPVTNLGSIGGRLTSGLVLSQGTVIDIAFIAVWNRRLTFSERAGLKLTLAKWNVA